MAATLATALVVNVAEIIASEETPAHAAFLDALVGNWEGQAGRTPRGPLPYDIRFSRGTQGAITGTANPGAALHHWRFLVADGELHLRFLTTFGGNTEPIWLNAETVSPTTVRFRAEDPAYLRVQVTATGEKAKIKVLLHGELHVHIALVRTRQSS